MSALGGANRAFYDQLKRYYRWYTWGLLLFVAMLWALERFGLPRIWIGYTFMFTTIGLYAGIGIMSRTADVAEYYVAGRRVPAFFNGMATAADWMSAATFIGMAGTLYLQGFDGLAYVLGWTGGYCLVAFMIAPYLRKFGQFTIPDFLGARFGGNLARGIGIMAAIICSFVYVVAQIYGVGLITTRFTSVDFGYGVFLGLAGILVCSFLGGMRAVTWTQVAQCIILQLRLRDGAAGATRAATGERPQGDRGPRHLREAGRGGAGADRCAAAVIRRWSGCRTQGGR
jgi:cation/acetate symporter